MNSDTQTDMNIYELYGQMVFNQEVMRRRLPREVYDKLTRTIQTGGELDASIADVVANAMKDWAIEKGATHFTHWFQPLTGLTAEKHDSFITPLPGGRAVMEFSGKELIKGEPDASSFPSGGLRATFEARGYTAWDPASFAFVKDHTLYIPTAFCSYTGEALDTKTPLLRSMEAVSGQALRLLRLFGDTQTVSVGTTVGAEQEYFLVNKAYFDRRRDLYYCGRTLFGAPAPKGQEMGDHYFGPLKPKVAAFMADLDAELWRLGINAKTEHNETAPSQHELAPVFSSANTGVDQNLLIMEYMRRVAERHGMVCLLHEKPYAGVNGSGKHNNWSLTTDTGKNLVDPGKRPYENTQFLLILSAIVAAVDDYQDLLRLSVASAGNDHRLGGCEAPPAIVSMFLGEELEGIVDAIVEGRDYLRPHSSTLDLGIHSVPTFRRDTTDRNRTSPFAFTGNKFEFRSVGSSQNIAMPNIVLNTAVAHEFKRIADRLERETAADGADFEACVRGIIRDELTAHKRIIFNGNGYAKEWEEEAQKRGLSRLDSATDAIPCLTHQKNVDLFSEFGVLNFNELTSRQEILLENYAKVIHIEAQTMSIMAQRQIIPAIEQYIARLGETAAAKARCGVDISPEMKKVSRLSDLCRAATDTCADMLQKDREAQSLTDVLDSANAFCHEVLPAMNALRAPVDAAETMVPTDLWPLPTYGEMMFMQ